MPKKTYAIAIIILVIVIFIVVNPKEIQSIESPFDIYLDPYEFSDICKAWETIYAVGVEGVFDVEKSIEIKSNIEYGKALAFDGEKLWIGHNKGISYYDGQNIHHMDTINCEVYDLLFYDGDLYIACFEGVYILGENLKLLNQTSGLTEDMVYVLSEDRDIIYAGAYRSKTGGLSMIKDQAVFKTITLNEGLSHFAITSINHLNDWTLIGSGVYTQGGLDIIKNEQIIKSLSIEDGLAGEKVRHIYVGDYLWICSEYDGIAIFSQDLKALGLLTTKDGLSDNECKMIYKDSMDNLWCAMKRGITKISKEQREEILNKMLGKGE